LKPNGDVLDTTKTNAEGYYEFCELEPGDYKVSFEKPSGYIFSKQNAGNDDAKDSDADTVTGVTYVTTLEAGEFDRTIDALIQSSVLGEIDKLPETSAGYALIGMLSGFGLASGAALNELLKRK